MFTFGFYNSLNGDRKYDALQMSSIFDGIIEDGVYSNVGEIFAVVPGDGLQVIVKTGRAWFKHTWNLNDSWLPMMIEPADVLRPRIDSVVIEVNSNLDVRENSIKIVKGTPATNPVAPTMIHEGGIDQFRLADITVETAATSISEANIANKIGQGDTPFVTAPVQSVDISDLFEQWNGEFNEWFDNVKAQLEGDVVTNLQRQIDERVKISDKATETDIVNKTPNKWLDPTALTVENAALNGAEFQIVTSSENLEEKYPGKFLACNQQVVTGDLAKKLNEKYFRPRTPFMIDYFGDGPYASYENIIYTINTKNNSAKKIVMYDVLTDKRTEADIQLGGTTSVTVVGLIVFKGTLVVITKNGECHQYTLGNWNVDTTVAIPSLSNIIGDGDTLTMYADNDSLLVICYYYGSGGGMSNGYLWKTSAPFVAFTIIGDQFSKDPNLTRIVPDVISNDYSLVSEYEHYSSYEGYYNGANTVGRSKMARCGSYVFMVPNNNSSIRTSIVAMSLTDRSTISYDVLDNTISGYRFYFATNRYIVFLNAKTPTGAGSSLTSIFKITVFDMSTRELVKTITFDDTSATSMTEPIFIVNFLNGFELSIMCSKDSLPKIVVIGELRSPYVKNTSNTYLPNYGVYTFDTDRETFEPLLVNGAPASVGPQGIGTRVCADGRSIVVQYNGDSFYQPFNINDLNTVAQFSSLLAQYLYRPSMTYVCENDPHYPIPAPIPTIAAIIDPQTLRNVCVPIAPIIGNAIVDTSRLRIARNNKYGVYIYNYTASSYYSAVIKYCDCTLPYVEDGYIKIDSTEENEGSV